MGNRFTGAAANPRLATTGGAFAFGDVNDEGADLTAYIAIAQDLCFSANSAPCSESDPESAQRLAGPPRVPTV